MAIGWRTGSKHGESFGEEDDRAVAVARMTTQFIALPVGQGDAFS